MCPFELTVALSHDSVGAAASKACMFGCLHAGLQVCCAAAVMPSEYVQFFVVWLQPCFHAGLCFGVVAAALLAGKSSVPAVWLQPCLQIHSARGQHAKELPVASLELTALPSSVSVLSDCSRASTVNLDLGHSDNRPLLQHPSVCCVCMSLPAKSSGT